MKYENNYISIYLVPITDVMLFKLLTIQQNIKRYNTN